MHLSVIRSAAVHCRSLLTVVIVDELSLLLQVVAIVVVVVQVVVVVVVVALSNDCCRHHFTSVGAWRSSLFLFVFPRCNYAVDARDRRTSVWCNATRGCPQQCDHLVVHSAFTFPTRLALVNPHVAFCPPAVAGSVPAAEKCRCNVPLPGGPNHVPYDPDHRQNHVQRPQDRGLLVQSHGLCT